MYEYKAKVVSVYDADTIRIDIDLGLGVWVHNEPIRIFGINAPEIRGDERENGLLSRDYLRTILPVGQKIEIETIKDSKGKYGRYLAYIKHPEHGDIAELLVSKGLAIFKDY